MKRSERIAYSAAHIRRLKVFERKYAPIIYKALNSQLDDAIRVVKEVGPDQAMQRLGGVILNERIEKALMGIYRIVGVYYANKTLREINRSARGKKGFGFDLEWARDIQAFFRAYILTKAVLPISETSKKIILRALQKAVEQGWGIDKAVEEIGRLRDVNEVRAAKIVRTETGKAVFIGDQLAKDKSEYETVEEWVSANDHRTRHSHRDIDGEVINSGGRFQVPVYRNIGGVDIQIGVDMMRGPGDPEATAGNVINCRCKRAMTAKLDERGRLVYKRVRAL